MVLYRIFIPNYSRLELQGDIDTVAMVMCILFSVESVSEKSRSKAPPIALNTVELLRACSVRLHISPKQTMDIAERLYTEVSVYIKCPKLNEKLIPIPLSN